MLICHPIKIVAGRCGCRWWMYPSSPDHELPQIVGQTRKILASTTDEVFCK
jgi:hypothetical protein